MGGTPSISFTNFLGGVQEHLDPLLIQLNAASKIQNFKIDDGMLSVCAGNTKFLAPPLAQKATSLLKFYKGALKYLYAVSNGILYNITTGIAVNIKSGFTGTDFDFINYQINDTDVMIFSNGVDRTMVYDGATFRDLKNRRVVYNANGTIQGYIDGEDATQTVRATEALCPSFAPKGKFIELHFERVWMAGDSAHPNTVYFSSATANKFDPDDWTAPLAEGEANQHGGLIDIPTWDGGIIIGLKVLFNDILIFKNKNIFRIFGTYPGNYQKEQLFGTDGAIADRTICASNNKAFFVATEGIHQFDGTQVMKISDRIKKTWVTLNKAYLNKSVGIYLNDKYIIAVPEGTSTINNLIIEYDTINGNFIMKRGFSVTQFLEFDDYIVFSDDTGNVYKYESGNTFDGAQISSLYQTGNIDLNAKDALKTLQMLYFVGNGTGSVKVTCTSERGVKSLTVPLTAIDTLYRKKFMHKGRQFTFKFENVTGSNITIKSPQFMVEFDYD